MADNFDFGFTAVDQDELTTKTGESAFLMRRLQKTLRKLQSHLKVQLILNR